MQEVWTTVQARQLWELKAVLSGGIWTGLAGPAGLHCGRAEEKGVLRPRKDAKFANEKQVFKWLKKAIQQAEASP